MPRNAFEDYTSIEPLKKKINKINSFRRFRELFNTAWPMGSSRSAKLMADRVNCSGQIISLRRFDKVSVEKKPQNFQNFTQQEIPQQSLRVSTFFYR